MLHVAQAEIPLQVQLHPQGGVWHIRPISKLNLRYRATSNNVTYSINYIHFVPPPSALPHHRLAALPISRFARHTLATRAGPNHSAYVLILLHLFHDALSASLVYLVHLMQNDH